MLISLLLNIIYAQDINPSEAALNARSILQNNTLGELATIMSQTKYPFCSVEFVVEDCEESGSPILALVSWGNHATNLKSNTKSSIFVRSRYWYEHSTESSHQKLNGMGVDREDRGLMDHARFTMFGNLLKAHNQTTAKECLLKKLRDTRWLQGHEFIVYKLKVDAISYVGGYGDEHYVGMLNLDDYFGHRLLVQH